MSILDKFRGPKEELGKMGVKPEEMLSEEEKAKLKELKEEGKPLWEEEIKFDPNRLEDIAKCRENWRIFGDYEGANFLNFAGPEKIINPDAEIENLTDKELKDLREVFSKHYKMYSSMWYGSVHPLSEVMANAKILGIDVDPDKSIEEVMKWGTEKEIGKSRWGSEIKEPRIRKAHWNNILSLESKCKVATGKDIGDKKDWDGFKKFYKQKEKDYLENKPQEPFKSDVVSIWTRAERMPRGVELACILADMRVVNPRINFDSLCSKEAIEKIRKDMEEELKKLGKDIDRVSKKYEPFHEILNYEKVAKAAKILSAEKVEVPPKGGLKVE